MGYGCMVQNAPKDMKKANMVGKQKPMAKMSYSESSDIKSNQTFIGHIQDFEFYYKSNGQAISLSFRRKKLNRTLITSDDTFF